MFIWCKDCKHNQSKICPKCKWMYPGQNTFKRKDNKFEPIVTIQKEEKIMRPEEYFGKVIQAINNLK